MLNLLSIIIISTLLFFALPTSIALLAIGLYSPYPTADIFAGAIPTFEIRSSVTFVALIAESCQFEANSLFLKIGRASCRERVS